MFIMPVRGRGASRKNGESATGFTDSRHEDSPDSDLPASDDAAFERAPCPSFTPLSFAADGAAVTGSASIPAPVWTS
jgi:hypothetical protein